MKEKMKKLFTKLLWIVVTFLFLQAILILLIVSIEALGEYKLDITLDLVIAELQYTFTNLPEVFTQWWEERHPLFLLGTPVTFIYSIYLHVVDHGKKSGWKTEEELGYHGTARWARYKELFDKENFIPQSKRVVQSEFEKSINRRS